jgi:hypothetical protein
MKKKILGVIIALPILMVSAGQSWAGENGRVPTVQSSPQSPVSQPPTIREGQSPTQPLILKPKPGGTWWPPCLFIPWCQPSALDNLQQHVYPQNPGEFQSPLDPQNLGEFQPPLDPQKRKDFR